MSLATVEEQIKTDWNLVRAFVATNQLASLAIVGAVCWAVGKFL